MTSSNLPSTDKLIQHPKNMKLMLAFLGRRPKPARRTPTHRTKNMSVAYTLNGKSYDAPEAEYLSDSVERAHCNLTFDFCNEWENSAITLSIHGRCVQKVDDDGARIGPEYHTVSVTFNPENIVSYLSYPLQPGISIPANFSPPEGYLTSQNYPKRIINFKATKGTISNPAIPSMTNPFVEELMTTLVRDVTSYKQQDELLILQCIVDEWRYDKLVVINIRHQIEQEKFDLKCGKCMESGHEAIHCQQLWCTECKMVGHVVEYCKGRWCPECNMAGHICREVSYPCKVCGEAGHRATDCKQDWCTKCQISGHIAMDSCVKDNKKFYLARKRSSRCSKTRTSKESSSQTISSNAKSTRSVKTIKKATESATDGVYGVHYLHGGGIM